MTQYPDEMCHLLWDKDRPWTLLFAVILSAQCTDAMVNKVTPVLFRVFPDLEAYAVRPIEELQKIIRPTGFYKAKALHLKICAEQLIERHNGQIPDTMKALIALRGVGRKTANVVLWNLYQKNVGFVVDTHVQKISRRTGLTNHNTPEKIEQDLMHKLPQQHWGQLSHMMVQFGRDYCKAPVPICSTCPLNNVCPKHSIKKQH